MKIKKHALLFICVIITSLTINSLFCAEQKEESPLIEEIPTEQIEATDESFFTEKTETPQKKPSWFQRFISKPAVKYTAFALTTGLILYTGAINMGYANSPMELWKQYFAPQPAPKPGPQPQPAPGQQPALGPQLPPVPPLDPKSPEILAFQLNSKINELQTLQNKILAEQAQQGQQGQQQQQQFQKEQQKQIFENAKVKNLQQKPNFDIETYNIPGEGKEKLENKLNTLKNTYEDRLKKSLPINVPSFNKQINIAIDKTRDELSTEEIVIGMKKQVKSTIDKKDLDLTTEIPELFKFEYHQKEFTEIPTIKDIDKKNTRIGWINSVFNAAKKEYEKEYQKIQNDIPSLIQLNEKTLEKINKIIEDNNLPY